jgi:hypothetical protein
MRVGAWLAGIAVVVWASVASGEAVTCHDCLLGVYDDLAMTRTTGIISIFQVKSVYLGVRLRPDVRIDQLSFDAQYPTGFSVVDVTAYVNGATYDLAGNHADVRWPQCVTGTRALFRVRVMTTSSVRHALLRLTNVEARACSGSTTESWLLPSGCYVMNPRGQTPPCATTSTPATWTVVKELFRDLDSR